jgi:hypothetical protein
VPRLRRRIPGAFAQTAAYSDFKAIPAAVQHAFDATDECKYLLLFIVYQQLWRCLLHLEWNYQ